MTGAGGLLTGEATPYYLFHPHAHKRAFELLPEMKLIVLLRNPIDRAWSHYHHQRRRGNESLSFEEAIRTEAERIQDEYERLIKDEKCRSSHYQWFSYLARGVYVDQLKRWMDLFPRAQFCILKSEDLYTDPGAVLRTVFQFLEIESAVSEKYEVYNQGSMPSMNSQTREFLHSYFAPHNARLKDFLGYDFGWD